MSKMQNLRKALQPSTSWSFHRNKRLKTTPEQAENLSTPGSSIHPNNLHNQQPGPAELEFAAFQQEQQALFAEESESQWTNHQARLAEFHTFMKDLAAQVAAAETVRSESFNCLSNEHKEMRAATNNLLESQFSMAENKREDAFNGDQALRQRQIPDLKRIWESRFSEGRGERQSLLKEAEETLKNLLSSVLESQEESFEEEERIRDQIVQKLLDEVNTRATSVRQSSSEALTQEQRRIEDIILPSFDHGCASTIESVHEANWYSDYSYWENMESPFAPLPTPLKPPEINPVEPVLPPDVLPYQLGCPSRTSGSPMGSSIHSQLSQPWDGSSSTVSNLSPKPDHETARPLQVAPLPDHRDYNLYMGQQKAFDDAQSSRQQLFERAEAERNAAAGKWDADFAKFMSTFPSRFDTELQNYSNLAAQAKYVEEENRNRTAGTNGLRREQAFDTLRRTVESDFDLANEAEAFWERNQKRRILRLQQAMVDSKTSDIETRFREAQRRREDALFPFKCEICSNTCMDDVLASYTPRKRKSTPDWPGLYRAGPCAAGPSMLMSQRREGPRPPSNFTVRTLFDNSEPLLRRSRPLPGPSPSSTPVSVPSEDTSSNEDTTFESAQRRRTILFSLSTQERRTMFALGETKRCEDFAVTQVQRLADFRDMRLQQDQRFQSFLIDLRGLFHAEETNLQDAFYQAEGTREGTFWAAQRRRGGDWEALRKKLLAASFEREEQRSSALEKWVLEMSKDIASNDMAWVSAVRARERTFSALIGKVRRHS